jgi:F-type H+-transporting ATPase subunit delta
MLVTRLGKRYAKSLLELATEMGKTEELKADMETLLEAIEGSREFEVLLSSPVIGADKKENIFKALFEGKLNDLTLKFMTILAHKGREDKLGTIAQGYINLYRASKGIEMATVTTAVELSSDEKEAIRAKIAEATGKSIVIEEKVDPSIIGGLALRIGDKEYNGSIAYQLKALKRQFEDNLYVPEF